MKGNEFVAQDKLKYRRFFDFNFLTHTTLRWKACRIWCSNQGIGGCKRD